MGFFLDPTAILTKRCFKTSDDFLVKECGIIEVTSYRATLEDQTYEIDCGEDADYPVGRKVRVILEDTNKPLEIAEIYAYGDQGRSSKADIITKL